VLELAPRDGVSITGQEVEITGQRSLSIGDGFGGSLETELGVMEIKAREVSMEDFDTTAYVFLAIANSIKYIQSMVSGSMGLSLLAHTEGEKNEREEAFAKSWGHVEYWMEKVSEVSELIEECVGIKDGEKDWDAFTGARTTKALTVPRVAPAPSATPPAPSAPSTMKSFLQTLVGLLDLILEITSAVYATVETIYSGLEQADEKIANTNWKDKLNHAALVTDNTIIESALVILTALGGLTASKIELKANGQIVMSADTIQHVYDKDFSLCATPTSAFGFAARAPKIGQAIAKGVNIGIDIANYAVQTHYDNQEEETEEL
jgi:hypothetical protein